MTRDEWISRYRARLEALDLDRDLVVSSTDAIAGVLACDPALIDESPEAAADDEVGYMHEDDEGPE